MVLCYKMNFFYQIGNHFNFEAIHMTSVCFSYITFWKQKYVNSLLLYHSCCRRQNKIKKRKSSPLWYYMLESNYQLSKSPMTRISPSYYELQCTCSTWVSKLSPNSWNDSQLTIEHEFCSAIFNGLRWNFYDWNWTFM